MGLKPYTLDEKLGFGKYGPTDLEFLEDNRLTVRQILEIDPNYIHWSAENVSDFWLSSETINEMRILYPNFSFSKQALDSMARMEQIAFEVNNRHSSTKVPLSAEIQRQDKRMEKRKSFWRHFWAWPSKPDSFEVKVGCMMPIVLLTLVVLMVIFLPVWLSSLIFILFGILFAFMIFST